MISFAEVERCRMAIIASFGSLIDKNPFLNILKALNSFKIYSTSKRRRKKQR